MSKINWSDTVGNSGVKAYPANHDFSTCVVADCGECNKEITELLDIAEYFRKRGMIQNADLLQSAVMRLNLYSGTRLVIRNKGNIA